MPKPPRVTLEVPSRRRRGDFLAAVERSHALHRSWARPPSTPEQYRSFLKHIGRPTDLAFFVCTGAGELAGFIHLGDIVRGCFRSAYVGYYAFMPHAGQGYMRAGLAKVVQLAFTEYGLHRMEANIQPDNGRSVALVRSLGFRREGFSPRYLKIAGRWRDHERWALTVEDWRSRRRSR